MNMRVGRKKYLGVNMWKEIKLRLPVVCIWLAIICLFHFNRERDTQLKEMIDQLGIETSHNKTDIIQLNTADEGIQRTINIKLLEMGISNKEFKEETMKDIKRELGLMESKLGRLEDVVERYSSQSDGFPEYFVMREEYQTFITALDTTLQITDEETMKGKQTLQEQIDQLRLEFDELIQKLEEHKRTKSIFQ